MSRMVAIKVERDSGTGALEQMVVAEYFSKHFAEPCRRAEQAR